MTRAVVSLGACFKTRVWDRFRVRFRVWYRVRTRYSVILGLWIWQWLGLVLELRFS
jgi:hypothetical protein